MNPASICVGTFVGFLALYIVGAVIYVRREMRKPPEVALAELFAKDDARLRELGEEREVEMPELTAEDMLATYQALKGNGRASVIFRKGD